MKYFILFFSINLIAMINYVPEDKSIGAFTSKKTCEMESSKECYPFNSLKDDPETMIVKDTQVDNPKDEKWALKEDFNDCKLYPEYMDKDGKVNLDDCRYLVRSENIGTEEIPTIVYPICTKADYIAKYAYKKNYPSTFPDITDDSLFAYCTKFLGYGKMTVKKLLSDQALVDAKNAKIAQELAEKQAKEQAKSEALTYIKEKKGNVDKLSKEDMNVLIEKILILIGEK